MHVNGGARPGEGGRAFARRLTETDGAIHAIVQTPDGLEWTAGDASLRRFDSAAWDLQLDRPTRLRRPPSRIQDLGDDEVVLQRRQPLRLHLPPNHRHQI